MKNLGKTVVFAHQEFLRTASARACESMKKLGKIGRWSLQNPPQSVLESVTPPKSTVERSKMQKNRPETRTNTARTQNTARKRPRAKNSANMPAKILGLGVSVGRAGLPLKHVRTALVLYLKHIDGIRLGTESGAADFYAPRMPPPPRSGGARESCRGNFSKTKSVSLTIGTSRRVREVESHALSKFQPPPTFGNHQNIENTVWRN